MNEREKLVRALVEIDAKLDEAQATMSADWDTRDKADAALRSYDRAHETKGKQ